MDFNDFFNSLGAKAKDWMGNLGFNQNYNQGYPNQIGNSQNQFMMIIQQFYNQYQTTIQSIQIGDNAATNTIRILEGNMPPNDFYIYKSCTGKLFSYIGYNADLSKDGLCKLGYNELQQ